MKTQSILGKISAGTHVASFGGAYLALRFGVGAMFFLSGWGKVTSDWTASSYLLSVNGPFSDWFHSLAGSGAVDALNAWGMMLIGAALLVGLCTRPAAISGAVLMVLYYLAHFVANTANGLIDEHVILFLVFVLFAAGGAGSAFGFNSIVLGNLRKPNGMIRFLFG